MRELLIQHDGKIETCTFRGTLFTKKKESIEQLLKKKHRNGPRPKDFNKNTDTYSTDPHQDKVSHIQPKLKSLRFEDLYDHMKYP